MKFSSYIAILSVALSWGVSPAPSYAQSSGSLPLPAEFPPASFTGRQYVDSKGCVFIRAGVDSNTTWVPRIARSRQPVCGFQPSLPNLTAQAAQPAPAPAKPAQQAVAAQPAPAAQPAQAQAAVTPPTEPVVIGQAAPQPQQQVAPQPAQPKPAGQVAQTAPAPAAPSVRTVTAQPQQVQPAQPIKVVTAQPKPVAKPVQMAPHESTCRWASPISSQYMKSTNGLTVRCGPQATPHVFYGDGGNARTITTTVVRQPVQGTYDGYSHTQPAPLTRTVAVHQTVTPTRVVPRHVYENQVVSTEGVYIPEGYKAAWTDDRLNPKRAHQTFAGRAQMEVYWTNTLPRELVERRTGRAVTQHYPGLHYPYTSYEAQNAAHATFSTKGNTAPQAKISGAARYSHDARRELPQAQVAKAPAVSATISTRSAVRQAEPVAATPHYIRAGSFADAGQAQRAAQKLANAGLPTKLGQGRSAGVVIVGPFRNQSDLNAAMNRVRGLGFGGAGMSQ